MRSSIVLLLLAHYTHGVSYGIRMTEVDLNCMKEAEKSSSSSMKILSFNIWNTRLSVPGQLDLSLALNVTKKLSNDLELTTKVERQLGRLWIELPCLSGIGACDKQSFCDLIQQACKSKSFIRSSSRDNQKPCSCDLDVGIYTLEQVPIYLKYKKSARLVKPITAGKYRFKLKIVETKPKVNTLGCTIGHFTLIKSDKSVWIGFAIRSFARHDLHWCFLVYTSNKASIHPPRVRLLHLDFSGIS